MDRALDYILRLLGKRSKGPIKKLRRLLAGGVLRLVGWKNSGGCVGSFKRCLDSGVGKTFVLKDNKE